MLPGFPPSSKIRIFRLQFDYASRARLETNPASETSILLPYQASSTWELYNILKVYLYCWVSCGRVKT
jgi:hypothetical protein